MCGYSNGNWFFSITTLVLFGALVAASIAFLIRSMGVKKGPGENERP
jgi:hypothetical protein